MKCLILEKLKDGRYQSTAYINADGSPTITIYKNAQEAALALPILNKNATDLQKDPDRAILTINPDNGDVVASLFQTFSTNKDEALQSSVKIQDSARQKVLDLANDILTKEGKPNIEIKLEGGADAILNP